jgi:hypothetical protein
MNNQIYNVVLCLRRGGDFSFTDVELLAFHLHKQWDKEKGKLQVICLFDGVDRPFDLSNVKIIPAFNKIWPGWWIKMNLFDPRMDQYRPFLYMDLDTAIVGNLDGILPPTGMEDRFITLGGFFRPDTTNGLQSGIMWFPRNNEKVKKIWEEWKKDPNKTIKGVHHRGGDQGFIRSVLGGNSDYWQKITSKICSFKLKLRDSKLQEVPDYISIVCFHGKPRIPEARGLFPWIDDYLDRKDVNTVDNTLVTVIIPYRVDRGWLQEAINSVPQGVQLLVSQGEGNWPENFNKALPQAKGKYIKYLHEDDMLTVNCIEDSVRAIEEQGVDFIHGKAIHIHVEEGGVQRPYIPSTKKVTLSSLLCHNAIHSATTMYKREIFEQIGGFNETLINSEEYEFNLRCLYNGFKIGYCDSNLAYYRRHNAQKSVTMRPEIRITAAEIAKKYSKSKDKDVKNLKK